MSVVTGSLWRARPSLKNHLVSGVLPALQRMATESPEGQEISGGPGSLWSARNLCEARKSLDVQGVAKEPLTLYIDELKNLEVQALVTMKSIEMSLKVTD